MKFTKKVTDTNNVTIGDFDSFDPSTLHSVLLAAGLKGYLNTNVNEVEIFLAPEDDVEALETAARAHFTSWPGQELARAIIVANKAIDDAAGAARARYITISPGQEATYIAKEVECRAYAAAGYPSNTASMEYLWVKAEASALGVTNTVAADTIITQANQWVYVGSTIEKVRRTGKLSVGAKLSKAEVEAQATATITALSSI